MGISIGAQENKNSEYVKSVKRMCQVITDRNFSPFHPKFFPLTPNYYKEKRALKVLHSHTDQVIEKRIEHSKFNRENNVTNESSANPKPAFLDLLIQATIDDKPLSRLDIREEVDTFMFEVSTCV